MQGPVGHDQKAYSTGMLQSPNGKRVFLTDDHAHLSYLLFKLHMTSTHTESIYDDMIIFRQLRSILQTVTTYSKNLVHKGLSMSMSKML